MERDHLDGSLFKPATRYSEATGFESVIGTGVDETFGKVADETGRRFSLERKRLRELAFSVDAVRIERAKMSDRGLRRFGSEALAVRARRPSLDSLTSVPNLTTDVRLWPEDDPVDRVGPAAGVEEGGELAASVERASGIVSESSRTRF